MKVSLTTYRLKMFFSTTMTVTAVAFTSTVYAAQSNAPPRPPGSEIVKIVVGEAPPEQERGKRAHHNKTHIKKDVTRNDTLDLPIMEQPDSVQTAK